MQRNFSNFVTHTGLYCSKQLETAFHQFCIKKTLRITFNRQASQLKAEQGACFHVCMSQRLVKENKFFLLYSFCALTLSF